MYKPHLLAALLLALGLQTPALADLPLPDPLSGEVISHEQIPFKSQFAPAQAAPDGSIHLFAEATRWQLWPLDEARLKRHSLEKFVLPHGPRLGYSESYPARYAGVSTAQGIWLLGPGIELIRPDGSRISGKLQWPRHQMRALALPDGSVLAIGGYTWPESRDFSSTLKLERVWLSDKGVVQSEALPPIPVDIKGSGVWESLGSYNVTLTANGQVMLAGSEYRNLTLLFDPLKRTWRKLSGMTRGRRDPVLTLLPDGRIWATGGEGWKEAETTSELWNPGSEKWEKGPDLPVPMVDHRALLNERKDTVILAGGYYPSVLAWKMDQAPVFIAGQHASQRRLAGVFLLPGERLALLGGRHARGYGEGWGRTTPGVSVIPLDLSGQGKRPPAWPNVWGGALLAGPGQLWSIGGSLYHSHSGSDQNLGTRLIERVDLATGQVRTQPPLPLVAGQTEAAWLKSGLALIHAASLGSEQNPMQWLGTLETQSGNLRTLPLPPTPTYVMSDRLHRRMRLVGAHAGQGWLVGEDGDTYRVSPQAPHYTPAPRLQRQRRDFTGRVLADGRVIVAGGQVESELVASRPADCATCPLHYIGFGPQMPSRRHEIFDPQRKGWEASASSRAAGGPVAILADGRVAKLGELTEKKPEGGEQTSPLLEISDASGKRWRSLALPPSQYNGEGSGELLSLINETPALPAALFLGLRQVDGMAWWWLDDVDAPEPRWQALGKAIPPLKFPRGEIDSGQRDSQGRKLLLQGGGGGVVVYPEKLSY